MFYNTSAIAIAPSLYSRVSFDPLKDYAPVALTATVPLVLAINPNVPVKSVQEFIAYARANPDKLNYASSGSGTITHLASALFASQTGVRMQHIPYKGSAPALADVVAGQVQMMIDTISTVAPYAKDNRLRALAIAIPRRSALLPDVPTLAQAANQRAASCCACSTISRSRTRSMSRNVGIPAWRVPKKSPGPRSSRSRSAISNPSAVSVSAFNRSRASSDSGD